MKQNTLRLSNVLSPLCAAAAFLSVQLFALWAMGKLFGAWNLTSETYPYAPMWARSILDASGGIARFFALCAGALIAYALSGKCALNARAEARKSAGFFACGALTALMLSGLLLLSGSIRPAHARSPLALSSVFQMLSDVSAAFLISLCSRTVILKPGFLACAVSGAVHAAFVCLLSWSLHPMTILNSFLAGCLLKRVFEKHSTVLYEICALSAFQLTAARAVGYPGWLNGVYPVSEAWLTGAEAGLPGSGALFILLLAAEIALIVKGRLLRKGILTCRPLKKCS